MPAAARLIGFVIRVGVFGGAGKGLKGALLPRGPAQVQVQPVLARRLALDHAGLVQPGAAAAIGKIQHDVTLDARFVQDVAQLAVDGGDQIVQPLARQGADGLHALGAGIRAAQGGAGVVAQSVDLVPDLDGGHVVIHAQTV